jgi:hypothetical protein
MAHLNESLVGDHQCTDDRRSPTATPLFVRCSTKSVSATLVSQLPVFEVVCPMKNSRKLRVRRDVNVLRNVVATRSLTAAAASRSHGLEESIRPGPAIVERQPGYPSGL